MLTIQNNYSLKALNTFGMDVKALNYTAVSGLEEVREALRFADKKGFDIFFLGGGSNVLFLSDLSSLVIKNEVLGISTRVIDEYFLEVNVGSGVIWHDFVMWSTDRGYGGVENLALIPGTVGASPIQNIGAYGVEVKDIISKVEVLNLKTLEVETFSNEQCLFDYRDSIFKGKLKGCYFVLSVSFILSKKDHKFSLEYGPLAKLKTARDLDPRKIAQTVVDIRNSKLPDPLVIPNAGSFFKNPIISSEMFNLLKIEHSDIPSYFVSSNTVKVPAGWLIDQAGWRGHKNDFVGVYERQALVLININNGTGEDIKELAELIISDVMTKFGICLEPEVNFIYE